MAAIAAGRFTDVDDTSIFKAGIQWMADSGITKGCNPRSNGKFCPQNTVTREQMAAFMRRLAEAKVVKADTAATAGDSDKLDGVHADDITPLAIAQVDQTAAGTAITTPTTINSASIAVPGSGVLIITGSVYLSAGTNGTAGLEAYIDATEIGNSAAAASSRRRPTIRIWRTGSHTRRR